MPYCILMDGLVKAGQTHEAKIIFDEMMKKQVKSGKLSFVVSFNEIEHCTCGDLFIFSLRCNEHEKLKKNCFSFYWPSSIIL